MQPGNDYTTVLRVGEHLSRRAVSCPTGHYTVVHQHDGNVVLYRNSDRFPVWGTGTLFQSGVTNPEYLVAPTMDAAYGRPGRLALERDGDLVVYSASGERLWSSGTAGEPVATLMIHDWGKLVLKNDRGHILWTTDRAPKRWDGWNTVTDGRRLRRGQTLRDASLVSDNGEFAFVAGEEGCGYLCRTGGEILWVVPGNPGDGYELTADGRFIGRSADGIEQPYPMRTDMPLTGEPAEMLVTDDGRLVLADETGTIVWTMDPPAGPRQPAPPAEPRTLPPPPQGVPPLPETDGLLLVRTDFSDDAAWDDAVAKLSAEHEAPGYEPLSVAVTPVDDRRYAGLTPEQVAAAAPADTEYPLVVIADAVTTSTPARHLIVVSLDPDHLGESARATTAAIVEMAINLGLANMDWDEFVPDPDDTDTLIESIS